MASPSLTDSHKASITPSHTHTHTSLHQSTSATGLHTPASTCWCLQLLHIFLISLTPHASITLSHKLTQSFHHSLSHTPASISRHLPPASTLWPPYTSVHSYSTYPTAHTYLLSRLTTSTPHKSASATASICRPPHTA